ncbi:MAG: hypothetical protein EP330_14400 [Deltaproteobacteria bacterium]|nr:MAG: hypothetical protein EP330_14400 [Deltaproteobacteria bacterium]
MDHQFDAMTETETHDNPVDAGASPGEYTGWITVDVERTDELAGPHAEVLAAVVASFRTELGLQ